MEQGSSRRPGPPTRPDRPGRERARRTANLAELADVAAAQGVLLAALLHARFRPTGQLVAPAAPASRAAPTESDLPEAQAALERRAVVVGRATRAIDRAARRGLFRPTCLVRSLALVRLLERWGVPGARIRIGVRRGAPAGEGMVAVESPAGDMLPSGGAPRPGPGGSARVRAHAWVELGGRVIGDDPRHVATFRPLGSVTSRSLRWR